MINNIIDKVKTLPRILKKKVQNKTKEKEENEIIRVIGTCGRSDNLESAVKDVSRKLLSKSQQAYKFSTVYKTGPSLKDKLCNAKRVSLRPKHGKTTKCGRKRCSTCDLMSRKEVINLPDNKTVKAAPGNCLDKNIVYLIQCKVKDCNKHYIGKTTQTLCDRCKGHRCMFNKFYKMSLEERMKIDKCSDNYALGIHLFNDHKINGANADFNSNFEVSIIEKCGTRSLSVKEHLCIQRLRSLKPHGLNFGSPFGFPLLNL